MKHRRVAATVLAALLSAVLLAGCAGKVETVHESPAFARDELVAGRVGVGGLVLATRLAVAPGADLPAGAEPGDVLGQSDRWAPVLYGALLGADPDLPVWPWPAVRDACPDSALADVLRIFALGGVVRPDSFAPLAVELDALRYLALLRVDADETTLHEGIEAVRDNQRARDGRDLHTDPRDAALKTRRSVTATLDLYDLRDGRSVWTAKASRHKDQLYDYDRDGGGGPRTPVEEGRPVITVDGEPVPRADFDAVLRDVCAALAGRLLGRPGGGD